MQSSANLGKIQPKAFMGYNDQPARVMTQRLHHPTQPNLSKGYIKHKEPGFHEHGHFGKGKHRVNPDAVNHEFRRKLWEGQIPVKVTLHY